MNRTPALFAIGLCALALTGCFGGGGDDAPAPGPDPLAAVPDSATQSAAGTVAYLDTLSQNQSDTREPLDVSAVVLPTLDDAEPEAVK